MAKLFDKELAEATRDKVPSITFRGKSYSTGVPQNRKGVRAKSPVYAETLKQLDEIWTPKEFDE